MQPKDTNVFPGAYGVLPSSVTKVLYYSNKGLKLPYGVPSSLNTAALLSRVLRKKPVNVLRLKMNSYPNGHTPWSGERNFWKALVAYSLEFESIVLLFLKVWPIHVYVVHEHEGEWEACHCGFGFRRCQG
ncbi:hypothetical protein V8G54_010164 [Vigna mungo]|uniref:Uncharacterized protein n=1 Tax=Vigna mungo TaxID=3915 RepID=A0AAQ3NYK7_VIGMU